MAGFLPTYANIHLARGFASGDGDLPHEEVRVYSSAHLERTEPAAAGGANATAWIQWGWVWGLECRTGSGSNTLPHTRAPRT